MGDGRLIAAHAGQGIIYVGQGGDLGGDGDLLALQAVGVAPSVIPLVVPAADLIGGVDEGVVRVKGQLLQHLRTDERVGLDDLKLLRGQPPGLVQNVAVDGDFTDVVEGGGGGVHGDVALAQGIGIGHFHQVVEQQLGDDLDVVDVHPAFAVSELHDVAQDVDHHPAVLFVFIHLLLHQAHQPPLALEQPQDVDDAPVDQKALIGPLDIVGGPQVKGPLD